MMTETDGRSLIGCRNGKVGPVAGFGRRPGRKRLLPALQPPYAHFTSIILFVNEVPPAFKRYTYNPVARPAASNVTR